MNQQEILKRISIINVKNKLGLEELFSKKDIIYVKCPFCYSKNGAMKLNIANNSYICKDCEARGYSVGLYAKYKYISNKEAYNRLINSEADISNNLTSSIITNSKKNAEELAIFVWHEVSASWPLSNSLSHLSGWRIVSIHFDQYSQLYQDVL